MIREVGSGGNAVLLLGCMTGLAVSPRTSSPGHAKEARAASAAPFSTGE
jgi:hypothetical protein